VKKFCAPFGRIQEEIDRLTPDQRERAARRAGTGPFADDCVQVWPNRASMLKTVDLQRRSDSHLPKWRPLVKREGIDGAARRRR
jgi:hypothetical protein